MRVASGRKLNGVSGVNRVNGALRLAVAVAVLVLVLVLVLTWTAPPAWAAEPTPAAAPTALSTKSWARTQCVAALELQAEDIAARIKAEQAGAELHLRDRLRDVLRIGAAYIGQAYLDGERDEQKSKAWLDKARQEQEKLPAAELAARQDHCTAQGAKLLADTNPLSRAIVSRLAEKRMKKMLGS